MVCGIDRAGPSAATLTIADDEDRCTWPTQVNAGPETATGQNGLVATPGHAHLHTWGEIQQPSRPSRSQATGDTPLARHLIDVWDAQSFDPELTAQLHDHLDVITAYVARDREIFLAHELGRSRSLMRPDNTHAAAFHALQDAMGEAMKTRSIRAWHYTRMTDAEVALARRDGIHLSTPQALQTRFDALVAAGDLTADQVEALYAASPFHAQHDSRSGKFWMTSHPIAIDDGGVEPLMAHWGGEVASMWMKDEALFAPLATIGRPRILEVAVPLAATHHAHSAGCAVVATYGRAEGAHPEKKAFDLYVHEPLLSTALLAVHTEGEATFAAMGRTHPAGFVDVSIGFWKELTGEDD
jgi:hypothetical protein